MQRHAETRATHRSGYGHLLILYYIKIMNISWSQYSSKYLFGFLAATAYRSQWTDDFSELLTRDLSGCLESQLLLLWSALHRHGFVYFPLDIVLSYTILQWRLSKTSLTISSQANSGTVDRMSGQWDGWELTEWASPEGHNQDMIMTKE